jgi:hypothetical protein
MSGGNLAVGRAEGVLGTSSAHVLPLGKFTLPVEKFPAS